MELLLIKLETVRVMLHCCMYFTSLLFIESNRPSMRDLNRCVTRKYATDWYDIGIELRLKLDVLDIIEKDHPQRTVTCFQKTLDKWLQLNTDDATWRTLEVALTNVYRAKLGLDAVDDVYGRDVHYIDCMSL